MNGRHQMHRPKPSQEQSERVALVIVTVPNRHLLATADMQQPLHDAEITNSTIRNGQQFRAARDGAFLQQCEPGIIGWIHVRTQRSIPVIRQKAWRIQDRLLGPAPLSGHDTRVQDGRLTRPAARRRVVVLVGRQTVNWNCDFLVLD